MGIFLTPVSEVSYFKIPGIYTDYFFYPPEPFKIESHDYYCFFVVVHLSSPCLPSLAFFLSILLL